MTNADFESQEQALEILEHSIPELRKILHTKNSDEFIISTRTLWDEFTGARTLPDERTNLQRDIYQHNILSTIVGTYDSHMLNPFKVYTDVGLSHDDRALYHQEVRKNRHFAAAMWHVELTGDPDLLFRRERLLDFLDDVDNEGAGLVKLTYFSPMLMFALGYKIAEQHHRHQMPHADAIRIAAQALQPILEQHTMIRTFTAIEPPDDRILESPDDELLEATRSDEESGFTDAFPSVLEAIEDIMKQGANFYHQDRPSYVPFTVRQAKKRSETFFVESRNFRLIDQGERIRGTYNPKAWLMFLGALKAQELLKKVEMNYENEHADEVYKKMIYQAQDEYHKGRLSPYRDYRRGDRDSNTGYYVTVPFSDSTHDESFDILYGIVIQVEPAFHGQNAFTKALEALTNPHATFDIVLDNKMRGKYVYLHKVFQNIQHRFFEHGESSEMHAQKSLDLEALGQQVILFAGYSLARYLSQTNQESSAHLYYPGVAQRLYETLRIIGIVNMVHTNDTELQMHRDGIEAILHIGEDMFFAERSIAERHMRSIPESPPEIHDIFGDFINTGLFDRRDEEHGWDTNPDTDED